jgi:hypothetical protein
MIREGPTQDNYMYYLFGNIQDHIRRISLVLIATMISATLYMLPHSNEKPPAEDRIEIVSAHIPIHPPSTRIVSPVIYAEA